MSFGAASTTATWSTFLTPSKMGAMEMKMLDTVHKVASVVMAAGLIGMFKFYVDVQKDLIQLKTEVGQANANTSLILQEINRLHPRH